MIEKMGFIKDNYTDIIYYDKINDLIDFCNSLSEKDRYCNDCLQEIKPEAKEEWPKEGDKYYWTAGDGVVGIDYWKNTVYDLGRRDFIGIYKTEAEALEARDKIREFVKSLNK